MSLFYMFACLNRSKLYKLSCEVVKCVKQNRTCLNPENYRFLSQKLLETNVSQTLTTFNDVVSARKLQANRSILVQVQSAQSCRELYSYCNNFGSVKHMFHYSFGVEPLHFIIVEFSKEVDVSNVLLHSTYADNAQVVPVQSSFLWFRAVGTKYKQRVSKSAKLEIENGTYVATEDDIRNSLHKEKNISNQMNILYRTTKLNDVGIRLRFMVARQIETALSGVFPHMRVYPFGSSVNGFGKMGCDLDLVLRLNENRSVPEDSRLVFHTKAITASERAISQRHMETIGDLLQLFLPGCSQVRRILQARVPIIKYYQQLADVECDLSMFNMSGVHMSDLLYIMGEIDDRVRPLVFTIRKWASEVGLTSAHPGRWITNFSLTLMVLAFLQKPSHGPPILPALNHLIKCAGPDDVFVTEDNINCTFLRNISNLDFTTTNEQSLHSLLEQFFEHYSQFDFSAKAICLSDGSPVIKPDHSPLYIVNPLERGLNVSKNVSLEELEKLKMEMRNATWILESQEVKGMNWGILSLFESKKKVGLLTSKQPKVFQVSKLFDEESKSEIELKNDQIGKQITTIKNETKNNIKQVEKKLKRQKPNGNK